MSATVYQNTKTGVTKTSITLLGVVKELINTPVGLGFMLGAGAGLAFGLLFNMSPAGVLTAVLFMSVVGALVVAVFIPSVERVIPEVVKALPLLAA